MYTDSLSAQYLLVHTAHRPLPCHSFAACCSLAGCGPAVDAAADACAAVASSALFTAHRHADDGERGEEGLQAAARLHDQRGRDAPHQQRRGAERCQRTQGENDARLRVCIHSQRRWMQRRPPHRCCCFLLCKQYCLSVDFVGPACARHPQLCVLCVRCMHLCLVVNSLATPPHPPAYTPPPPPTVWRCQALRAEEEPPQEPGCHDQAQPRSSLSTQVRTWGRGGGGWA